MLNIEDLARIYVKENTGSEVICCDYYESGFGYLFTNCGGKQVVILNEKLKGEQSQQLLAANASMGFANPLWNFTELDDLVAGNCARNYKVVDEFKLGNNYDVWLSLDLPWQQWIQEKNLTDLNGLKIWLDRYREFLVAYGQRLQQSKDTSDFGNQILSILQLFPQDLVNASINQLVENNTEMLD